MSNPQPQYFMIQDGDEILEIGIYTKNPVDFNPPTTSSTVDRDQNKPYRESYGIRETTEKTKDIAITSMQEVHKSIRLYTRYAIGAFKDFSGAEIQELNLKFGLKIGGKTGLPMLTEGSGEANFEIEVKCKFPNKSNNS